MYVTSRPIHFTSNQDAVIRRLSALGLTRIVGNAGDCWQVFSAPAGGRIGVHAVEPGDRLDGVSRLGFETPTSNDLYVLAEAFEDLPGGATAGITQTGHGIALKVTAPDGISFLVDTAEQADAGKDACHSPANKNVQPGVEMAQMWFTGDTAGAREVLLRLGAKELITTKGLGWDDARLPGGGRTQLHACDSQPRVSVGFMSAQPLEQLKSQVDRAGDDATIVDESWGRYLDLAPVTINKPETGLDGELTWVNEDIRDYYGYQVHQNPIDR